MRAELWTVGQPLGELTPERVAEIQGEYTGPLVAVLDDNGGVKIIQPMDPNTGKNWESEEAALSFAHRYMTPSTEQGVAPEQEIPEE
jgi:hypothetical protein